MLQLLIATLLALPAGDFDAAKADPSKRMAWLAGILDKQIYDKEKNPKGLIQAWYYVADEKQMAAAQDAIKARYKKDGREFYFAKDVKNIFAPLESQSRRAVAWYSDSVAAGSGSKSGLLLIGDVFALGGEAEALSVIEDYVLNIVKMREDGLKVKELELDANIPALKLVSNKSLLPLYAQAAQLEAVLKGGRKVSEAFRKDLTTQYLASHSLFSRMYAHEKKVYDDNNENTLQKEIVEFLDECFKFDDARFQALGLQHKLLNKENFEYSLEKK